MAVLNRLRAQSFGTSLFFSGTSSSVSRADEALLDITGAFTLSAWIYRNGVTATERGIISKTKYNLILTTTDFLRIEIAKDPTGTKSLIGNVKIPQFTWVHVAATYDLVNLRLYSNGAEYSNSPSAETAAVLAGTETFNVGTHGGSRFRGYIDDPRVYTRALSAAEIYSMYQGLSVSSSNLLISYNFNEGSGATALDASGNSLDGTNNSLTYSSFVPTAVRTTAGTRTTAGARLTA